VLQSFRRAQGILEHLDFPDYLEYQQAPETLVVLLFRLVPQILEFLVTLASLEHLAFRQVPDYLAVQ